MNKVILLGRLVRDVEVRYSAGATPIAVARFHLAVNRRTGKKSGSEAVSEGNYDRRVKAGEEKKADFIPCVAFGKMGEFAEKYLKKGQQISVVGRIQTRSWNDSDGSKRWSTDIVVEEVYFATAKTCGTEGVSPGNADKAEAKKENTTSSNSPAEGFYPIDESVEDDDLPF